MRTPLKEIGEMAITHNGVTYFFKPTLSAMYNLGDPEEIVRIFSELHLNHLQNITQYAMEVGGFTASYILDTIRSPVIGQSILVNAIAVLSNCCEHNQDELHNLIGYWTLNANDKLVYKRGAMYIEDIIVLARRLMQHGTIGCCELPLNEKQKEDSKQYTAAFNAVDYINFARTHLKLSYDEAAYLTMTEMQLLLKQLLPEEKPVGHFTDKEYNDIMEQYYKDREKELNEGKNG